MLIDDIHIHVKAGDGGNGAATFRRSAQTTKGGPDGGNGGNGGNVYFQGINDILGLHEFQFKKNIEAETGVKGRKQNLYGRNGKDTIIRIPIGTYITDEDTGEVWEVVNETTKVLLAQGGRGGRGNNEFKSATNQTPTFAEKGQPGQERNIRLELKIIADIGFIGLPNAGKSSLLKALTNAHPKVGSYPFTTLEPNLGVLFIGHPKLDSEPHKKNSVDQVHNNERRDIILADIPGLIEGAHIGKGLGIKFLKHIEKTKCLIHCIDATEEDVAKTYTVVRNELQNFGNNLTNKKEIILLTKIDLISTEDLEKKKVTLKKFKKQILSVSIYKEETLQLLKDSLLREFAT